MTPLGWLGRKTSTQKKKKKNLSKSQWIFTKLDMSNDIVDIWFWIAIGYISSLLDIVITQWHDNGWELSFHVFIQVRNSLIVSVIKSYCNTHFRSFQNFVVLIN